MRISRKRVPAKTSLNSKTTLNSKTALNRKTGPRKNVAPRKAVAGLITAEAIERHILVLRGHRVMLDRDLAELYGVPLKRLNEQVKRNQDRFPGDFMFRLTLEEGRAALAVRSQIATLESSGYLRHPPHVFTEHGAVMLANVLKSPVAVQASIQVVRAFVRLRSAPGVEQPGCKKGRSLGTAGREARHGLTGCAQHPA